MPTNATCPHCKVTLQLPDTVLGQSARCPKCKGTFKVPPPVRATAASSSAQPARSRSTVDDQADIQREPRPVDRTQQEVDDHPLLAVSFADLKVPEDIQGDIRGQLNAGEEIIWLGRPVWGVDLGSARPPLTLTIIGIVLTLLGLGGIAAAVYYLNTIEQNALLFAIIPGLGGLLLLSGGVAT